MTSMICNDCQVKYKLLMMCYIKYKMCLFSVRKLTGLNAASLKYADYNWTCCKAMMIV